LKQSTSFAAGTRALTRPASTCSGGRLDEQRGHVAVGSQLIDRLVAVVGRRVRVHVDPLGRDPLLGTQFVLAVHERSLGVVVAHQHRPERRRRAVVTERVEGSPDVRPDGVRHFLPFE
jgi:hypothetical protein